MSNAVEIIVTDEEWVTLPLSKVAELKGGFAFKSKEYTEDGIPILRMGNITKNFQINWNKKKQPYYPEERIKEFEEYLLEGGELVICLTDMSNTGHYLGTVAINSKRALLNQRVSKFLFDENAINQKLLYYALCEPKCRHYMISDDTGSLQKNTSHKHVLAYEITFPKSLEQQKSIVAKIEELFSHIDAGIEALKKAKQLLKQYRQSVLKAAVTGELTKEWREANSISQESWKDSTIGEIASVQTGKTPKRSTAEFWENGTIAWLTSSATNEVFTHQAEQFVTQAAVDEGLKLFEPGTLLLAMYGEGKTRGQVTEITFQATCNQACAAIIVDESKASRAFVRLRLYENYEETRKAASGGNQSNLNLSKVRDITLPLPTLAEQDEIVIRVVQKFEAIERLENDIEAELLKTEKNKQSILASAFSGNLNQG
ncbi:MAG: restriction endonuclease subunit S [Candidatus Thiodiazotropha endolucinida]